MANDESITSVEIWKPVVGYEGLYSVSNLGRVRSDATRGHNGKTGRIMTEDNSCGYAAVRLTGYGCSKAYKSHRLVCSAFIPNPLGLPHVNHKNGVRMDNRVENLEWCTALQNSRHAIEVLGKHNAGERNHSAKLVADDVRSVRAGKWAGMRNTEVAAALGVCESTIRAIRSGRTWRCIV